MEPSSPTDNTVLPDGDSRRSTTGQLWTNISTKPPYVYGENGIAMMKLNEVSKKRSACGATTSYPATLYHQLHVTAHLLQRPSIYPKGTGVGPREYKHSVRGHLEDCKRYPAVWAHGQCLGARVSGHAAGVCPYRTTTRNATITIGNPPLFLAVDTYLEASIRRS